MLDGSNRNLPELNARSVDATNSSTSGSEGQATRGSHSTKPEPKRKLLVLPTQTNDMSIQYEPFMVDEACQTKEALSLPQTFMSFSDVCHAVQHDHNYACIDDTVLGKKSASLTEDSKAEHALQFVGNESADHH